MFKVTIDKVELNTFIMNMMKYRVFTQKINSDGKKLNTPLIDTGFLRSNIFADGSGYTATAPYADSIQRRYNVFEPTKEEILKAEQKLAQLIEQQIKEFYDA